MYKKYSKSISTTSLSHCSQRIIKQDIPEGPLAEEFQQNVAIEVNKLFAATAKYVRQLGLPQLELSHFMDVDLGMFIRLRRVNRKKEALTSEDEEDEDTDDNKEKKKEKEPEKKEEQPQADTESRSAFFNFLLSKSLNSQSLPLWQKRERIRVKSETSNFPLSREQQSLYEVLIESCMGSNEPQRQLALQSLSNDPSLDCILPYLSMFIADSVQANIARPTMAALMYLMRMVRSLQGNANLSLHKYLHLLIPAVLSCLLTRQNCAHPHLENHWALREYAGNVMTELVRYYGPTNKYILSRVIGVYKAAISKPPLTTLYGAVIGLGKMGNHAVRAYIVTNLPYISARIEPHMKGSSQESKTCRYIRHRVLKLCAPILKNLHTPPDDSAQYESYYGYLGSVLCAAVIVARIKEKAVSDAKAEQAMADALSQLEEEDYVNETEHSPATNVAKDNGKEMDTVSL